VLGEAVEVVQQRFLFGGVDFDSVGTVGLPVSAEDKNGAGFDLLSNLPADGFEAGVYWVSDVVHCGGAAVGDEVDGCAGHVGVVVEMDADCLYATEAGIPMVRRMVFTRGKARMSSCSFNSTARKMTAIAVYKAGYRGTVLGMRGLHVPLIKTSV